ncbi:hypothetical protein KR059_002746, partial [Drosophila kikkawai]
SSMQQPPQRHARTAAQQQQQQHHQHHQHNQHHQLPLHHQGHQNPHNTPRTAGRHAMLGSNHSSQREASVSPRRVALDTTASGSTSGGFGFSRGK